MTSPTHPLITRLRRTARPRRVSDGAALTRFAQHHDSDAFAQLVERFGPMVQGVCRRVLGDTPDADDAYQATFVVLVRKARTVHPPEAVGSWLFAVAHRTAVYARTVMNRRSAKYRPLNREPANEPPRTPEVLAALDTELASLPDKFRDAVVLCELRGKSLKEAADALGVPVGTLASRLARGRQLLADRLKGKGFAVSTATVSGMLAAGGVAKAAPGFDPLAVEGASTQLADGVMKMALLSKLKLTTAGVLSAMVALAVVVGLLPGSTRMPTAHAAPVPKADDKLSEKKVKDFDELWLELADWRAESSRAALGFLKNPTTTVAYFRTKLKPLKLNEKEAKKLIAQLADDKEDVWKAAEHELIYRQPILAMKLPDIWAEAKTPEHKARLAMVLCGMKNKNVDSEFELVEEPGDATYPFKMQCKYPIMLGNQPPGAGMVKATDSSAVPEVISKLNAYDHWHRAERAILVLEHVGTPDAMKLLEEMATGHDDANPTKAAKDLLARLKKQAN